MMLVSKRALGLSKGQKKIFDIVEGFIERHGHSPSFREIAAIADTPLSNVSRYMHQLRDRGIVDFGDSKRRSIIIKKGNQSDES